MQLSLDGYFRASAADGDGAASAGAGVTSAGAAVDGIGPWSATGAMCCASVAWSHPELHGTGAGQQAC